MASIDSLRRRLADGLVIPACPLALNARRKLSSRHQRALVRYYRASGAGGLAVGVHTTQFAIRHPKVGLFRPVLELVRESWLRAQSANETATKSPNQESVLVAGICGRTVQAISEAETARMLGYDCGLLSLGALRDASDRRLIAHCQSIAKIIPIFGFYLQPAAGGRVLGASFWRRFAEIPQVVAIKIAPFNRYQTLEVIRAVVDAGRADISLYTGNDDNIVFDLLAPYRFAVGRKWIERRIVGGLLGHWAVWTKRAVELQTECRRVASAGGAVPVELLQRANEVTDANAAIFDPAHQFAGCIPGIHEVLRRQGLLPGVHCLDPRERLSPGQAAAIDRVTAEYPHLTDDAFVAQHRDEWLRD